MIPALLTSTSSRERVRVNARANRSMDARLPISSIINATMDLGISARTSSMALCPRSTDRQARIVSAPLRANSLAVFSPIPLLASVTTTTLSVRSGIWETVQCPCSLPLSISLFSQQPRSVRRVGEGLIKFSDQVEDICGLEDTITLLSDVALG